MAEARTLRDGVKEVLTSGYRKITIEGDNPVIINALRGIASIPWQITNIIEDVRFWLSQNVQYEINHIFREANMTVN